MATINNNGNELEYLEEFLQGVECITLLLIINEGREMEYEKILVEVD